jgi:hypothetical protein
MEAKPRLKQTMQEEQIRTALNAHWHASAVGDANARILQLGRSNTRRVWRR